jgi:hypothetical protein
MQYISKSSGIVQGVSEMLFQRKEAQRIINCSLQKVAYL